MPPDTTNIVSDIANSNPIFQPTSLNVDYFFNKINHFFQSIHGGSGPGPWPTIYFISYVLSLFGVTMIVYCLVRLIEIDRDEHEHLKHAIHEYAARQREMTAGSNRNERWDHIRDLVNSANASDWKLSIIEADTVLEGLLDARDIPGNGIGEKLKNISPGDLGSMQAAWEAHLVRNRIAHEGTDFEFSQHDARRTLQLYEVVFRELGFL